MVADQVKRRRSRTLGFLILKLPKSTDILRFIARVTADCVLVKEIMFSEIQVLILRDDLSFGSSLSLSPLHRFCSIY